MKKEIRFWFQHDLYIDFSNFASYEILVDELLWPTVEHFYQAEKTFDLDEKEAIRKAFSPSEAKRLGRKACLRPDWEDIKENVMLRALRAKFNQYPILAETLSETGGALLIEDSPYDRYWGGKLPYSKNRLGMLLMLVRDELHETASTIMQETKVELSGWQYFTCPSCGRHARMEVLTDFNDGTWVVCEFCSEEAQPVMLTRKVLAIDRLQTVREFVERVNKRAEANMAFTGKLEGSHHLAIQRELAAMELSELEAKKEK